MSDLRALAREIGETTEAKRAAYGDSAGTAGEALRLLWPDGIPPERYGDVLLIARIWDKLSRIAHDAGAFGEDPWLDVAGYGLVGAARRRPSCN